MPPRRCFTVPLPTGGALELGRRTLVMGVLNVTPDSFSDGGLFADPGSAIDAGARLAAEGADILDIGGESTRPGADPVDAATEMTRVLPVIAGLVRQVSIPISIDTTKSAVAGAALEAGATIVNDISGLRHDRDLGGVAASATAVLVLMHTRGRSSEMYRYAQYADVIGEVAHELEQSIQLALQAGVSRDAIILDPGLGFAKRAEHSLELLARLDAAPLAALDRPWLVGSSRKSFLTSAIGDRSPLGREWATAAAVTAAVMLGAHIVRVHRVAEMLDVVRVADALRAARESGAPASRRP